MAKSSSWLLIICWTLATFVPAVLGLIIATLPVSNLPDYSYHNDNQIGPMIQWVLTMLITVGVTTTIAQAVVLRFVLQYKRWWVWIPTTILGIVIGGLFSGIVDIGLNYANEIIPALIFATVLGLAQWGALHQFSKWAGLWLVVFAFAWCFGLAAGHFVGAALLPDVDYHLPFYPSDSAILWTVQRAVQVLVVGVIMGCFLSWLEGRPNPKSILPQPSDHV